MLIDLSFQGHAGVIATAVLPAGSGVALVDPGPTSCLPALEAGLAAQGATLQDVRSVLLTHIHLDHAGSAGTIAARVPGVSVYVHERGAPHMADPTKLLASATRLYGDAMDRLWGAFEAVPAESLRVLRDGDRVEGVGAQGLFVRYTPGHASHHVTYFDEHEGTAYVGDTAGVQVVGRYLLAPTPPPDIDIEVWEQSLDRIAERRPERLLLTHFGSVAQASDHLARFRTVLRESAARVADTLAGPGDDAERMRRFADVLRADARRSLSEQDAVALELAAPFDQVWQGLARYWRKREAGTTTGASERPPVQ
jgi:glyoxylase-like metal-dependent hydrolase (beta-lactamase superfamily II)